MIQSQKLCSLITPTHIHCTRRSLNLARDYINGLILTHCPRIQETPSGILRKDEKTLSVPKRFLIAITM